MSKITLFLMSEKGYHVLKEILSFYDSSLIDFVVVASDKNVTNDFSEEILILAEKHKIRTLSKGSNYQIKTRYALAISWRWLIAFKEDQTQLIILHDSLLPKYRGFAPLVNQLIQKEPILGVTAFFAKKGYDTGDIIYQQKTPIRYPIKISQAIVKITSLYTAIALKILEHIEKEEELWTKPQNEQEATYSLWRDKEDYKIDWDESAINIKRFIDAVGFPYLGASTAVQGRVVRIRDAEVVQNLVIVNRDCGKALFAEENHVVVVCGKGLLKITEAIYDDNKKSIFPLKKFRLRFS